MDPNKKDSSEDIQTDAQVEPDENEPLSSSQYNEPTVSANPKFRQNLDTRLNARAASSSKSGAMSLPVSLMYAQSARPITSSDDNSEYLQYLSHMPPNLQEDNCDILIINAESDMKAAADFRNHLTKDILFYIHREPRHPKVKLLDEIRHGSMDHLDLAFSKALYVFLFVTKEFCAAPWTLLQGQACLTEAIHDYNKKWCVVPIHTTSKKSQRYKLPMMLNSLRPINYWSGGQDQFYIEGVRKLLESKTGLLLERERLLDEARRNYFLKNRSAILKNAQYKNIGLSQPTRNMPQLSSYSSSPLMYPVNAQQESSKLSALDCSNNASAVYQTDVDEYSSLSDEQKDKAVPDEVVAIVGERMEEINISETQTLPENNELHVRIKTSETSCGGSENGEVPQQPGSSGVHSSNCGDEHSQHSASITANSHNSSSDPTGQAPLGRSTLTTREPDSSIDVDGPVDEEPASVSVQQSQVPGYYQYRVTPNITAASSAHTGTASTAPTYATQNAPPEIAPSFHSPFRMHSPAGYGFPGFENIFFDNLGRPAYMPNMPMLCHPWIQPQFFYPNYVSDPNLHHSLNAQPYPSMLPYSMQDLYSYANPIPPPGFRFPNAMRLPSQISEPASDIENSQLSTQVNASNSLRSSLSHDSLNSAVSAFGTLPGTSNRWPSTHFSAWNSTRHQPQPFSQFASHHLTSFPLTRQHMETVPVSFAQQIQTQIPYSDKQETLVADQLGTGITSAANTDSSAKSAGTFSGSASSAANSVVQHIHHHHHQKKITVAKATNVLIGDRSQFLNKDQSLDIVVDDENSADDDGETPADESGNSISTRAHASKTSKSIHVAKAEPQGIASRILGNTQNKEASMGFAECPSPASSRQPVEGSEHASLSEDDEKNETTCKKMFTDDT